MIPITHLTETEAAEAFVARIDAGTWSEADEAALQAWLGEDPRREGLLLRTHAAWVAIDGPVLATATPPASGTTDAEPAPDEAAVPASRWRRRGVIGALAASVAAVAGGLAWLDRSSAFATRLGEIRRVPLADGSVMTINSGSELKVHFEKARRQVELAHGEAWFEVAKDATRPFIVAAGNVRAQAIGTAFSVRMRDEGVEVLVSEGVVETWSAVEVGRRIRLNAGQRAMVSQNAEVHFEASEPSSVDRALAWRSGMIDLNGITLGEAAEEFNRYNERHIVISDPDIAAEELDGLFRIDDPEGFALAVRSTLDVRIDMNDPRYIHINH